MLKPFRIRNLYLNASDLFDCSGVIQLSSQQYEQEIRSAPEAALAYLDEDDGETITIGSSFELEQRLLEPPGRFSSWNGQLATDNPPPLHVFDVKHSTRATNTWHKYAIPYTQPSVQTATRGLGLGRETHQHDDHRSLLAKVQVLELEVKLLKEAFRTHTIVSPARPETQRSVSGAACRNSRMSAQNRSHAVYPPPYTVVPWTPIGGTESCSQHPQYGGLHQTEPHLIRQHSRDINGVLFNSPAYLTNEHAAATMKTEQIKSLSPNHQTRQEDGLRQTLSPRPWLPATNNMEREKSVGTENSREKAFGEFNGSQKLEAKNQKLLARRTVAEQATGSISSTPSMRQTVTYAQPTPHMVRSAEPQQSSSKSLMDLEPEAEIARFPTIFQLEKGDLQSAKGTSGAEQASGHPSTSLARANTVTSSNPAARLLKPFDPATEGFGVPSRQFHLPRRSGTEQHRRRPFAEPFSGAGKTLWQEFERSAMQETSTAALGSAGSPQYRSVDVLPPRNLPPINRSQSLKNNNPVVHQQPSCAAPMRNAFDFSGTKHSRYDQTTLRKPPQTCRKTVTAPHEYTIPQTSDKLSKQIQTCIQSLQEMGYKPPSRLPIYAEACGGNVSKAIAMAEEDEQATHEAQKRCENAGTVNCVKQLKEMGYDAGFGNEELERFAKDAGGNAEIAVERLEAPSTGEMNERKQRLRNGLREGSGMPGSFP